MPDGALSHASDAPTTRRYPRLPDQISVNFGPAEILGPAFLAVDRAVREQGVYLSVSHDLEDLLDANKRNRKNWYPLLPMFDASVGGITPETGFWVRGVNGEDEVVAAHACRLYSWPKTSLIEEFRSMRFMYPDPEVQKNPGEECIVETEVIGELTGRVCYSGAMWVRPDYRGRNLASLIPRVTRAYALTRWYPNFIMGMVKSADMSRGAKQTYGWPRVDSGVRWRGSNEGSEELDIVVGWFNQREVATDLEQFTLLLRGMDRAIAA